MIKRNYFYIILMLIFNTYSYSEENSSILNPIQRNESAQNYVQIPFAVNNTLSVPSQDADSELSQGLKDKLKTTEDKPKSSEDKPLSEPSKSDEEFKDFLNKKTFLKDNKKDPSLWQGATLVVGFLSLLGVLAFVFTKFRSKGLFKNAKPENAMNIISTLSITPKRQVMLLQIRDKEIVISNTESGINYLADLGFSHHSASVSMEKKPAQIANFINSIPISETSISKTRLDNEEEKSISNVLKKPILNEKKSDILMKALKRMETDKGLNSPNISKSEENKINDNESNGKFPKYFSNLFEAESKKEIRKKEDQDSVENVTNLIREKLKSMKALN